MKSQSETAIVKACLSLLAARGCLAVRINTTGVRRTDKTGRQFWTFNGLKGVSDILGALPGGRMIACEVKRPGKKPTANQYDFLERVAKTGGFALWVDSAKDLDEALAEISPATR